MPDPEKGSPAGDSDPDQFLTSTWARVKEHKILQWGLGYFGAALALAHGTELLAHTFHWPETIQRLVLGLLIVGLPLVLMLAWYHGHKGLKGASPGELMIASILLVIGAGLLIVLVRAPSEHAEAEAAATKSETALATAPRTSVAVMPFANLTGDATKDYLGDGMAEELINTLSKVPGLRIPSRTSTFAYKDRNVGSRHIAQDLHVGTLLEGSVRIAGTTLRISVILSDANSDSIIWSQDYNRDLTDLFKLQDEVANAIVRALQVNLKGQAPESVAQAPPTRDIEAYVLYLRARQAAHLPTEQSLRESQNLFEQAVERDPDFARAYSALALTRLSLRDLGYSQPDALEDAERDAARALALDPNLASAQAILGIIQAIRGDWIESETSFRAAMAQDPSEPEIIDEYCLYLLLPTGRLSQALDELRKARRLAPADHFTVGLSMAFNAIPGRDAEALKFAELAVELGWTPEVRPLQKANSLLAQRKGRYSEAADFYLMAVPERARASGGEQVIRSAFAALGKPAERPAAAKALRGLLQRLSADEGGVQLQLDAPLFFTGLQDLDSAFEFANQHDDQLARFGGSGWGDLWTTEMRPFRRDPRFQSFVARFKFMPYWQQYGPPDGCVAKASKLVCS